MIKKIELLEMNVGMHLILEHPLDEIKEVSMFVFQLKLDNKKVYLFTIPLHKWSFLVQNGEEIQLIYGPGSFQQERYKQQLVSMMKQAISIMNEG